MEIIITVISIISFTIIIQIYLWRKNKIDKENLSQDWITFLKASENSDIQLLIDSGDKLIWNKHLKQNQLTIIIEVVDSEIENNPELKKLKLNAFNKQLHYDRTLPYSGSSGGKN